MCIYNIHIYIHIAVNICIYLHIHTYVCSHVYIPLYMCWHVYFCALLKDGWEGLGASETTERPPEGIYKMAERLSIMENTKPYGLGASSC